MKTKYKYERRTPAIRKLIDGYVYIEEKGDESIIIEYKYRKFVFLASLKKLDLTKK